MIRLTYGNTNTYFISGLLIDTDYAGTIHAFFKAIKENGIGIKDIQYVMATHYHPDHMGIIGELTRLGIKLLLIDVQRDYVHFSDEIFERSKLPYISVDETKATVISCENSRDFLKTLGISGKIIHTPCHSKDSVSLVLDNGDCFVGDLEPYEYMDAYAENEDLKKDWDRLKMCYPKRIFFAHMPERKL